MSEPACLSLILGLVLAGCGSRGDIDRATTDDGMPSVSALQRAASSAANGGNVNVRLIDGIAYVSGRVDSVIEENAIKRVLRRIEGVTGVETALQRDM